MAEPVPQDTRKSTFLDPLIGIFDKGLDVYNSVQQRVFALKEIESQRANLPAQNVDVSPNNDELTFSLQNKNSIFVAAGLLVGGIFIARIVK